MNKQIDILKFYDVASELNIYNNDITNLIKDCLEVYILDGENDTEDAVINWIDNYFIYDVDMWEVMKYFQRPTEANYYEAEELFINLLIQFINNYKNKTK